jgi:hypothetical protein
LNNAHFFSKKDSTINDNYFCYGKLKRETKR